MKSAKKVQVASEVATLIVTITMAALWWKGGDRVAQARSGFEYAWVSLRDGLRYPETTREAFSRRPFASRPQGTMIVRASELGVEPVLPSFYLENLDRGHWLEGPATGRVDLAPLAWISLRDDGVLAAYPVEANDDPASPSVLLLSGYYDPNSRSALEAQAASLLGRPVHLPHWDRGGRVLALLPGGSQAQDVWLPPAGHWTLTFDGGN